MATPYLNEYHDLFKTVVNVGPLDDPVVRVNEILDQDGCVVLVCKIGTSSFYRIVTMLILSFIMME